jgi:hypothetical protein
MNHQIFVRDRIAQSRFDYPLFTVVSQNVLVPAPVVVLHAQACWIVYSIKQIRVFGMGKGL